MIIENKKLPVWGGITLLIMAAIFFFSSQNGEESSALSSSFLMIVGEFLEKILPRLTQFGIEYDIRKYAHMFEYACLGVSFTFFYRELCRNRILALLFAELSCLFYACTDEFHQTFVPGRVGCLKDVGVDAVGFTTGIALTASVIAAVSAMREWKKRKNEEGTG